MSQTQDAGILHAHLLTWFTETPDGKKPTLMFIFTPLFFLLKMSAMANVIGTMQHMCTQQETTLLYFSCYIFCVDSGKKKTFEQDEEMPIIIVILLGKQ